MTIIFFAEFESIHGHPLPNFRVPIVKYDLYIFQVYSGIFECRSPHCVSVGRHQIHPVGWAIRTKVPHEDKLKRGKWTLALSAYFSRPPPPLYCTGGHKNSKFSISNKITEVVNFVTNCSGRPYLEHSGAEAGIFREQDQDPPLLAWIIFDLNG